DGSDGAPARRSWRSRRSGRWTLLPPGCRGQGRGRRRGLRRRLRRERGRWRWGGRLPGRRAGRRGREMALVAAEQGRLGFPDRVLERIAEGDAAGRDDVRVAAHRRPLSAAVLRVDDDPRSGTGRRISVEDPDLVI